MLAALCASRSNKGNRRQKRTFILVRHILDLCVTRNFSAEKLQKLLADLGGRGPYRLPQDGTRRFFAMCANNAERNKVVF